MNKIDLKDHQKVPIEFMKTNYGLLLYHTVGSGKTITSLLALYQFINDIIIIGPKSSKKTFIDEINMLNLDENRFIFYTFQKIKKKIYDDINLFTNKSIIIDEAHHLRNETKDVYFLASILQTSFKIILLTATPIVNYLNDLSPLINIIKKENILPIEKELFNFYYFDDIQLVLKNENSLKQKLLNSISYHKNTNIIDYPKSTIHYKSIVMNIDQINEYAKYVKRFIYDYQVPSEINLFDIKFDYLSRGKKNSFLSATRMLSNGHSKIDEIIKLVQIGDYPIVIYSNFLETGLYPVAKLLSENNISHKIITGNTTQDKLINTVNGYNNGRFKVLLLSSAGSESITLKNTRQLHIMEPHFNDAKINQVIGRVIRYKSHELLKSKDKHVNIYYWSSIFPSHYNNISADEYLIELSRIKTNNINAFESIIIEASIEKNL